VNHGHGSFGDVSAARLATDTGKGLGLAYDDDGFRTTRRSPTCASTAPTSITTAGRTFFVAQGHLMDSNESADR
jgi:hypothetical protein